MRALTAQRHQRERREKADTRRLAEDRPSDEQPNAVRDAFESGACARVMRHLESLGAADGRWRQAVESAFARALPVELGDGETGMFAFVLMPRWLKASWRNGSLQPAKLYHLAKAKLVENAGNGVVRRQTFDGA